MNQDTTDALMEEVVNRLIRYGRSDDYINGFLEGVTWGLDFLNSSYKLIIKKSQMIEEEHAERTT